MKNSWLKQTENYLRFSGASIAVTVNPAHWHLIPYLGKDPNEVWAGPREHTWRFTWIMLTVRVWIDDGSW